MGKIPLGLSQRRTPAVLSPAQLQDMYGERYVASFEGRQSPLRLERLVDRMDLRPHHAVADFACGNGMMMPLVAGKVGRYVGVDFSPEFIAAAEKRMSHLGISNGRLVRSDIVEFCSANEAAFDIAFAMDFSEHVYDEDWVRILHAIRRSLKPGGKLYLHTPNADFFLEKMKARNFIVKQFPEHIAVRGPAENCALLEAAGFRISIVRLIPHYNILRLIHPLSFVPLLGKCLKARIFIEAVA